MSGGARRGGFRLPGALGPMLGLGAVLLFFGFLAPPSFATLANMQTVARQSAIVGTAALGMTLVIISGGIDLSVGSVIALTTVVIAYLLKTAGMHPLAAALLGVGAGAWCGLVTGLLVTQLRMVPFIVTLGMMLVIRGVAKNIADEKKIDAPLTGLNRLLAAGGAWDWPPGVWLVIGMAVIVAGLLRYTVFGRHVFAVGSNAQTARLCGVRVDEVRALVYTLGGTFAGLAGVMQFSRLTVGDPTVAIGKELDVIAAVVIGGGSLAGGEGSVPGSLIGALIMTVIRNGCSQMGLPTWVQEVVTGGIIVLAVAVDSLRHRLRR
ncbi:MAG: ABC transporter permease [Lentisphaerae bacterium]|nr:ABC transporter permease [Lentisphaerota bacterium]